MNHACSKNRVQEYLPTNWSEFDALLGQAFGAVRPRVTRAAYAQASVWEDKSAYYLELDLPGVSRDGVELTLEKGVLQIAAERNRADEEQTNLLEERLFGKVTRTFTLPELADPEGISAELKEGVLHVTVAKVPVKQPRQIEVN